MITLFRLYITYTKRHPLTSKMYVGKASALVDAITEKNIEIKKDLHLLSWIKFQQTKVPFEEVNSLCMSILKKKELLLNKIILLVLEI